MSVHKLPDQSKQSESTPDLTKLKDMQISERAERAIKYGKMKAIDRDDCIKEEIVNLRTEMFSLMKEFTQQLQQDISQMHLSMIDTIKGEISSIKVSISELHQENQNLKSELVSLRDLNSLNERNIKILQSEVNKLKLEKEQKINSDSSDAISSVICCENLAAEIADRAHREKNFIIVGLSEPNTKDASDRLESDKVEAHKHLKLFDPECPAPLKTYRIGKFEPGKKRPLKVCFESATVTKNLLRAKAKITCEVKIYADRTPMQQKYMKQLQLQLQQRIEKGEKDIGIRYFNGVPKITNLQLKH